MTDEVTVVIPTRGRPGLVRRAVESALAQGPTVARVVVIIDGQDPATATTLRSLADPRLEVIERGEAGGAARARNVGVAAATTDWIAFLDDDDEWLPGKLASQLALARTVDAPWPIVLCRLVVADPGRRSVWPRRLPGDAEPLSEYLYVRHGLLAGEGAVQTSTIVAPRAALEAVPFDESVRRHQDHDWLLRVVARPEARLAYDPAVLVVWHRDDGVRRMADGSDWRYSAGWARSRRDYFTPDAYASFLLVIAGDGAARRHDIGGALELVREASRAGTMRWLDLAILLGKLVLPGRVRSGVRAAAAG